MRRQITSQFESSPGRLLRWAALDWMIILAVWTAMARFDELIVTCIGIAIVASRIHALGALLHDACHSRNSSAAWPLVEAVAGWPIASTITAMRYHHLRHHRFSGTALDPYRHAWIDRGPVYRAALVLRGALLPFWWTMRAVVAMLAWRFPKLRAPYARPFLQDRSNGDFEHDGEVLECITADARQLCAQTVMAIGAFLIEFPVVEYYLIPWSLAGIVNARRVLVEHAFAESADSIRETVYSTTHDHDTGPLLNSVLYPHNIGLHRTHHLYPTASFVHLPRLSVAVDEIRRATNRS